MLFKDKLRQLREQAGLTQQQLAEQAGVPIGSLRNHEQGQRLPGWATVVRLSRGLGISTEAFSDCDDVAQEDEKPVKKPSKQKGKSKDT